MTEQCRRIQKLEETVVNRIAAGEVVQRPSSAIKELLENSLDAGSTSITITVKNGGLDLLQISDNGHGIHLDDLPIVCERFTTSKLTTFDDLLQIGTFGFRGEALASITHVARVSIVTRTPNTQCAYKAHYLDGKLTPPSQGESSDPRPTAGVDGTIITVEDLFHNMPTRKAAFKQTNDEYLKILDVITRYSVHFGQFGVSMTCKKHGKLTPDLHVPGFAGAGPGDKAKSAGSLAAIRVAYGTNVARELQEVQCSVSSVVHGDIGGQNVEHISTVDDDYAFTISGWISGANYAGKKACYLFFVNNRLVESGPLRRVCESVYSGLLPKHSYPFVYLSLSLPPHVVDVNVHPTKREVHFLQQEHLYLQLAQILAQKLGAESNQSRAFPVQALETYGMNIHTQPSASTVAQVNNNEQSSTTVTQQPQKQQQQAEYAVAPLTMHMHVQSDDDSEQPDDVNINNEQTSSQGPAVELPSSFQAPSPRIPSTQISRGGGISYRSDAIHTSSNKPRQSSLSSSQSQSQSQSQSNTYSTPANKFVRVDGRTQRIDSFFQRTSSSSTVIASSPAAAAVAAAVDDTAADGDGDGDGDGEVMTQEMFCAVAGQTLMMRCQCCSVPRRKRPRTNTNDNDDDADNDNDDADQQPSRQPRVEDMDNDDEDEEVFQEVDHGDFISFGTPAAITSKSSSSAIATASSAPAAVSFMQLPPLPRTQCPLDSVQSLLQELDSLVDPRAERQLRTQTVLVGLVDASLCLVQCDTKLMLVHHYSWLRQLFYQLALTRFGEVSAVWTLPKQQVSIHTLVARIVSIDSQNNTCDANVYAQKVCAVLMQHAELLWTYYRIRVVEEQGVVQLDALPELLPGYQPAGVTPQRLGRFLIKLAADVCWQEETTCLRDIARHVSWLYAELATPRQAEHSDSVKSAVHAETKLMFERVLFPAVKKYLRPLRVPEDPAVVALVHGAASAGGRAISAQRVQEVYRAVGNSSPMHVEVTSLEKLYRVFERC